MVELVTGPPPPAVIARIGAIAGVAMTPAMLVTQRGPEGHLGPEAAGALLILQATFADADKAAGFWDAAAGLTEQLAIAPGFIRRYNFADGPHYTLFVLWRTTADAHAFFASDAHQAAMKELFTNRWQYTHFAGLWEVTTPRQRVIFCQQCDGVTPAGVTQCIGCGIDLHDPYVEAVGSGSLGA